VTDIIDELTWRGLISQSTDLDELGKALDAGPVTLYGGFDPTAPGLHIGNLVLLLTMRRLQLAGHRPIALVGGATGLIGDPSGKSAERVLNSRETIAEWVERIRGEVSRFLDFSAEANPALTVSNLDWTAPLSALEFLRDIGKHFPVSQMLGRESVRARLESGGISYTEFSYQILQAYDFLELFRRHGCMLQIGGSDQWGNLVSGVDLIRRVTGETVHALATPLITKPDGTKYGKTEGGAIWISPDLMSPYAFYQFWLNRADEEVPGLLRVFTFRSQGEIEALEEESRERPAGRMAQRVLAAEVTELVHGAEETEKAIAASRALFGRGDLTQLDEETLAAAFAEIPSTTVSVGATREIAAQITADVIVLTGDATEARVDKGQAAQETSAAGQDLPTVADLMAAAGIVPSKSAGRRAIAEGGAYLNNRRVQTQDERPGPGDLLHGRYLVLRRGKRVVAGVRVESS
jgi:tyrosyl-tRNA synthetase